jgi:uncharacterized HAD superfamily protein
MRPTVCAEINEFYGLNLSPADITEWDFAGHHLNRAQYQHFIANGLHRDETILAVTPFPGVAETLSAWRDQGAVIHIVTHRAVARLDATRSWLSTHGIPYDELVCHPSIDKFAYARSQGLNLVIDDKPDLLEQCATNEMPAATISLPYHRAILARFPQIITGTDWPELSGRLDAAGR